MKSNSKKVLLWCAFLTLLKFIPRLDLLIKPSYYIYLAAFSISVILIYLIPKRIGIVLAIIVTAGVSVYQLDYFLYALPVLLLICAHREIVFVDEKNSLSDVGKKSKKEAKNVNIEIKDRLSFVFCGAAVVFTGIQFLFVSKPKYNFEIKDTVTDMRFVVCYLIFLVALLIVSLKAKPVKHNPKKNDIINQYRVFYIVSVVCLIAFICSSYLSKETGRIENIVELNYWFVLIVAVIWNKDYFLGVLTDKFNALVTRD